MEQALGGVYFRLVLTTFFWGGTFIAGRHLAGELPLYLAASLRFCFALIGLLLFVKFKGCRLLWPDSGQWWVVILLGATGVFAYNAGFFGGLARVPASRAALLVAASPVLTLCAVQWISKAPWSARQVCGLLLSLSGVMLVVSRGQPGALFAGALGEGEAWIAGAVLAWVLYTLIMRYLARGLDVVSLMFFSILSGTLMLMVPALFELRSSQFAPPSLAAWLALAYMGFLGTTLSFVWYAQAVEKIGAARATQFTNLVPVFGVLLSVLLLGERLSWPLVLGGGLVLGGVLLANRRALVCA